MSKPDITTPRVLLLSTAFEGGGAEHVSRQMHYALAPARSLLFTSPEIFIRGESTIKVLPAIPLKNALSKIFNNLSRLVLTQYEKIVLRPELTISHLEGPNFLNLLTFGGGRRVIFVHNSVTQNYQKKSIANTLKLFLARRLYKLADATIAVSTRVKDDLRDHFGVPEGRLHVLPNPININEIQLRSEAEFLFKDQPDLNYALCVASLSEQKNHSLLLNIFAEYQKQDGTGHLVIVGAGPLEPQLRNHCTRLGLSFGNAGELGQQSVPTVIFCGFSSNPYPLIKNARCLILTSKWEGQPIVILEALALGVPFLTTNSTPFFSEYFVPLEENEESCGFTKVGFFDAQVGIIFREANFYSQNSNFEAWINFLSMFLNTEKNNRPREIAASELSKLFDITQVKKTWFTLFSDLLS